MQPNKKNKIAILGFTPREEVIVDQIRHENPDTDIVLFSLGINKALEERVDDLYPVTLDRLQDTLVEPMRQVLPDLVLIGPDRFSIAGARELLEPIGIPIIGANQEQMRVETDKSFLRTHAPEFQQIFPPHKVLFDFSKEEILSFIKEYPEYVVKFNGLYHQIGGGVKLSGHHLHTFEETLDYIRYSLSKCGAVVLEKQVSGKDFSVNALSSIDGSVYFFPENVCYKRRDNGDKGPNTSGTGSYAIGLGLPFLTKKEQMMVRNIVTQIVQWMEMYFKKPFICGLNVDFRKGNDDQIYLLEVNSRFAGAGTLSTVVSLNKLKLMDLFLESVCGSFKKNEPSVFNSISLSVFAYPKFWPDAAEENHDIFIPRASAMSSNIRLFTGWVDVKNELSQARIVTLKQSTTLLFQTVSETLEDARNLLYTELSKLSPDLVYRTDIGLIN